MPAPLVYGVIVGGRLAYMGYRAWRAYRAAKKLKDAKDKLDKLKKAEEAAKKAKKPKKKCTGDCEKKYERPSGYRKGVKDKVWDDAKGADGKVRDPVTGKEIKPGEKWDMGHKPGYEFKKHQDSAAERGLSRKDFLDEHNNPSHYRPELPSSNRGHTGELKTGDWLGM
jgi:predicted ribonuclease toxin of YeeF-YezG toxin-antitoxin module